jgi:hypothetical protein
MKRQLDGSLDNVLQKERKTNDDKNELSSLKRSPMFSQEKQSPNDNEEDLEIRHFPDNSNLLVPNFPRQSTQDFVESSGNIQTKKISPRFVADGSGV